MRIIVATDQQDLLDSIAHGLGEDVEVELAGNRRSAWEKVEASAFDVGFFDLSFLKAQNAGVEQGYQNLKLIRPGMRLVLMFADENLRTGIELLKKGADEYLTYPIDPMELSLITEKLILKDRQLATIKDLQDEFWSPEHEDVVNTQSSLMRDLYDKVKDVAPTNSTVMIQGETGVGKGVLARLIHHHSARRSNQFIHVHCGAISENLIESELFGHEKGAFTGAIKRKLGRFELADKGTIFLDEISTLSASAQVKLLQVMQDGIFQRVGGESDIKVNVRIIAATNDDLHAMSESGQFRRDLFYRLNVFPIEVPPLRERLEDIPYIVDSLLRKHSQMGAKQIQGIQIEALEGLSRYSWPGNIRELENLVERAFVIEKTSLLSMSSFPKELFEHYQSQAVVPLNTDLPLAEARNRSIELFERQYLTELLEKTEGKVGRAAELAGITTRQLNNLMNRHKILKENFKKSGAVSR